MTVPKIWDTIKKSGGQVGPRNDSAGKTFLRYRILPLEDGRVVSFVTAYQSKKTERTGVANLAETALERIVRLPKLSVDCRGLP